ncbi:Centromere protein M [Lamellibrachia satsuma]|nr:Centromere protein M [Lamellibrachia satsuma]
MPRLNGATALIVGVQGVGKHRLAEAMVDVKARFSLQIRTATSLPLPSENAEKRPCIDFIIFMVDLTNRQSYHSVERSLCNVDVSYFLGKVCFLITQAHKLGEQSVETETVSQLSDAYDSPMLCCNINNEGDRKLAAEKLLSMIEVCSGFTHDVTPMLLDTTRTFYQYEKL